MDSSGKVLLVENGINASENNTGSNDAKYREIFDQAHDCLFLVNAESLKIQEVNTRVSNVLGYSKTELKDKAFLSLFEESCQKQVKQILEGHPDFTLMANSAVLISKEQEQLAVEIHANEISLNQRLFLLCSLRGTSEKQSLQTLILNSKKNLQNTFDGIQDGICQVNKDFDIVIANKKLAEFCHATPEELIGRKCYDIIPFCYENGEGCPVQSTIDSMQPYECERTISDRVLDIKAFPIFGITGTFEAVAVHSRDITEKKNLEKRLIQSEKLSSIGLLASGIAHEIRNPLNVIETARYYIEEFIGEKHPDILSKLDIIHKNVHRASNIINNLLEFSRHSDREKENVDVASVIETTVALIHKEFVAKNIKYEFNCQERYTVYVNIDSLKQVILNIIINALQAMPSGGQLTVSVEKEDSKYNAIRIADTGEGIPEKNLRQIFSPFFTTKEVGVGTGLGLYITHLIVEREGGEIKVKSQVGEGTTFTLLLPETR